MNKEANKDRVGKILYNRRLELRYSTIHVAKLTGLTRQTVYNIENGRDNISLNNYEKVAKALNLELTLYLI